MAVGQSDIADNHLFQSGITDASQDPTFIEIEASAPVLGTNILHHIRQDMDRTSLPSWVSPAPRNWGTTERGKLSADQWRVLYTIHLPISLIALWSGGESRYVDMLHNFMHLVVAVRIAGLRVINDEYINTYETCITSYVQGLKDLYPDASIKPNHHLSLHLGDFMRRFGPVHAYRTFAFERLNYLMQQMPTNKKHGDFFRIYNVPITYPNLGELERTFLLNACRSANLRVVLHDQATLKIVDELVKTFDTVIGGDRRGSRLSDLRNPSQCLQVPGKRKFERLEEPTFSALLIRSGCHGGLPACRPPNPNTYTYNQLVIRGTQFQTEGSLPADSYIFYEHHGIQHYGQIKHIFLPPGQEDTATVLLAVQRYIALSEEDREKDPYRLWGFCGGELVYNRFHEDYLIIEPKEVIGHIATTTLGHVFGIAIECVHVLPLDQVFPTLFTVSSPAYNLTA